MKQPLFQGCATALATPFTETGAIHFDVLGQWIEFQIAGKADALVVCGTTGESAAMSERERLSVLEFAVWKTAKRIPVIAGTGTNDTRQSVELTRSAARLGADGALTVCPYYNKPPQEGLLRHFTALADCSDLPVILYDVPSRTGSTLAPETLQILAKHPNIAGLKDATGSLAGAAKIRALCGEDLPLYSGDDGCIVPFLSLGGKGVISVASNLLPKVLHDLCAKWFEGDLQGAAEDQIRLMPLINALFKTSNPIPVKAAMEVLGYPPAHYRLPLCPLPEEEKEALFSLIRPWIREADA